MSDEFGDASFLDDFDVDAAVASRHQSQSSSDGVLATAPAAAAAAVTPPPAVVASKRHKPTGSTTADASDEALHAALVKYFGFDAFRPGQQVREIE